MIMLDTNICSYIIRREGDWAQAFAAGDTDKFAISSLVAYELELWKHGDDPQSALAQLVTAFLRRITILPFGKEEAAVAARVVSGLLLKGRSAGALDPLIAGHAIAERAVLVTNNLKDFRGIPDLNVVSKL